MSNRREGRRRRGPSVSTLQAVAVGVALGAVVGVGGYTFIYAKGYSYMTNDPRACADCHMPYTRVGAMKISDHHVRSPLLNINNACQTCHRWPEEELRARVTTIQDRTFRMRNIAMDALIQLIADLRAAREQGRLDPELQQARDFQRRAQFYLDFIEAENSMGFHADQEAVRILGESINFSRLGQVSLRGGITPAHSPAAPTPTTTPVAAAH